MSHIRDAGSRNEPPYYRYVMGGNERVKDNHQTLVALSKTFNKRNA